ncbi:18K peptidoglycan-associated outer membrane lipoprotein Peptidoglycan-associated lipoprotein precursor Outer membrane protein P6 OmpA/MotB precursor [Paramagnetospirillum magnetotacticum MS-1]|uniref:18K peptidoglycan-associated outer membrane lipoprotein Peptidoglycan-associated lipoprotein Outer membrane protein P6 OmpA/MotB n=1 Tax=Paramagnetospirillum magnetotacticum MS-1 TaxID=272627 RepID=A0A0C2UAE5_PARME|nr:18K peptidoglycan-associated outer membrane lipoprotein Peptidoglycan-associated lipoprotein precursor Outer membrane protein P6 OmpA/MotB precursor [Paramagnetospirillum magnetotacticum MS-1]
MAEAREIELPFDSDRLDLNAKAKAILDGVAEELKRNSTLTAILAGHADDRGSREYNLALGERRAEAVKTYLAVHGAPVERMAAISYGKEQPRDTSGTKAARAANRRVVVRLEQH